MTEIAVQESTDVVPFTREHEDMLREVHAFVVETRAAIENLMPMIQGNPMLAAFLG